MKTNSTFIVYEHQNLIISLLSPCFVFFFSPACISLYRQTQTNTGERERERGYSGLKNWNLIKTLTEKSKKPTFCGVS